MLRWRSVRQRPVLVQPWFHWVGLLAASTSRGACIDCANAYPCTKNKPGIVSTASLGASGATSCGINAGFPFSRVQPAVARAGDRRGSRTGAHSTADATSLNAADSDIVRNLIGQRASHKWQWYVSGATGAYTADTVFDFSAKRVGHWWQRFVPCARGSPRGSSGYPRGCSPRCQQAGRHSKRDGQRQQIRSRCCPGFQRCFSC